MIFYFKCPKCNYSRIMTPKDLIEKNTIKITCPICGKKLVLEINEKECEVICPLCKSTLKVSLDGKVKIIQSTNFRSPNTSQNSKIIELIYELLKLESFIECNGRGKLSPGVGPHQASGRWEPQTSHGAD